MFDVRVYLDLEAQLLKRLKRSWRKLASDLHAQVVTAVEAGDFSEAYALASQLDMTIVGTANRQYIKYMLLAHANFGARVAAEGRKTFVSSGNFDLMLEQVAENFCRSIEHNASLQAYKGLVQLIASAERESLEARKAEKVRYVKEFVDFTEAGDSMLQLISSLHSSRLAVWGFAAEAEILGYTKYRLSAVLDGRTSAFCRMINGKVFLVEDARRSINTILAVENPDDVKTLQPWPKQDKTSMEEYATLTSEELTQRGLHIPPFHPNCRTLLVNEGRVPRLHKPQVEETEQKLPTMQDAAPDFTALGLDVGPDALKHWNDYMGVSPLMVLSRVFGYSPDQILEGALGAMRRKLSIAPKGDIRVQGTKKFTHGGKVGLGLEYDPYSGVMHLSRAEYFNVSVKRATHHYRELLGGVLDTAQSVGASTLSVSVGGELGALTFTRMGLLPSPSEWFSLKETLLEAIEGPMKSLFKGLKPSQAKVVLDLLNSKDEKALRALASLPYTVGGKNVSKELFKGLKFEAFLDMTDKKAVALFKEAL